METFIYLFIQEKEHLNEKKSFPTHLFTCQKKCNCFLMNYLFSSRETFSKNTNNFMLSFKLTLGFIDDIEHLLSRDVSIPIRCVSLFISQDILHKTYPLSNHHWCSACMPMLHSLNNPLQKVEVVWSGVSIPTRHTKPPQITSIFKRGVSREWRIRMDTPEEPKSNE